MIRKAIAVLVGSGILALGCASVAVAAPGDPSIDVDAVATTVAGTVATNTSIEVLGTTATQETSTQSVEVTSTQSIEVLPAGDTQSGDLSYTGVAFNVPLTIAIAVLVLLGGAALVWLGGRRMQVRRLH